jgi:multimeric flavodoxin WrbA
MRLRLLLDKYYMFVGARVLVLCGNYTEHLILWISPEKGACIMNVKILGINGSPRQGNTTILLEEALRCAAELPQVETELIQLHTYKIDGGCIADYGCYRNPSEATPCHAYSDDLNSILYAMVHADGLIIGSPVFWGGVTAQLKMLIDRSMGLSSLGKPLRNKVGGAITVGSDRQGGQEAVIAEIQRWFLTHDMIVVGIGPEHPSFGVGSFYGAAAVRGWPQPISGIKKESKEAVWQDEVGIQAARNLGKRVTEMAKVVKAGYQAVDGETAWPSGNL